MSPHSFGIYTALLVAVGFADVIGQFGAGAALVQTRDITPGHETAALVLSIAVGVAVAAAFLIGAPLVARQLGAADGTSPLRVLALAFPLAAVGSVSTALLQRDLQFRPIAIREATAHVLAYALLGVPLAVLGAEVWALVAALVARTALQATLLVWRRPPRVGRFTRAEAVGILRFGGGLTFARVANYVALQADKLLVARQLGILAVGYYGRAYELMALPASVVGQLLDRVTFPVLARVQDDHAQLRAFLLLSIRWGFGILAPASVAVAMFAEPLAVSVLGERWAPAGPPLAVLSLGMAFRAAGKVPDNLLQALDIVYPRAWVQWIYAAAVVAGTLAGMTHGIQGVAWGVVVALGTTYCSTLWLCGWVLSIRFRQLLVVHAPGLVSASLVVMGRLLLQW